MQQEDKVLFTEKVPAGKRTYFLDVKEDHRGSKILKITESRKNDGEFIRHSVMIFQEDFDKIFDAFEKTKGFIKTLPAPARREEE
jgi:3-hydroxymyristoyl/3-hydroxydecanoyl-(acyl carrier protein) dehydratase